MSNQTTAITLRPVSMEDEAFLYEVYAGERGEELAAWGWDQRQQELFLRMQLKARDQSYRMYYEGIDDRIILAGDDLVGRVILGRTEEELRLIDISLLPAYRNLGVGTSVIEGLFAEADETGRTIRLQVERTNQRALSLYERLGFSLVGENQTHFQMERRGGTRTKA